MREKNEKKIHNLYSMDNKIGEFKIKKEPNYLVLNEVKD